MKPFMDMRVLLGRMEKDMEMWASGYEEPSQRLLNDLLQYMQKALALTDDADESKKLQTIIHQLEHMRKALSQSEPVDRQQAQQIIEDICTIRHARTSILKPVEVEDVVGASVIFFYYGLSTVGQVVRFRPAGEKRAFGSIGDVVIRLCDDQQAMKDFFQKIYPLRDSSLSKDLYYWSSDLPLQTFQEPSRPKDLVTVQWALPRHDDDKYSDMTIVSIMQHAGEYLKGFQSRKTIRDGDRRIGMPVYSLRQNQGGYLESIQIHGDGSERWTAIGDDGKQMSDESNLFWLEIQGFETLFAPRLLKPDDLYQKVREALALNEELVELRESAKPEGHDEIIQLHWKLDRIQKFLSGDMEDEQKECIIAIYQQMLWSDTSLNKTPREEMARQTANKIAQLRR